jgi:hypothetical protein
MRTAVVFVVVALSVSACFAVTDDVDGIQSPPTLAMSFDGMYQHANQHFEFVVVDSGNFVQTRGVADNLQMKDGRFKISAPLGVPRGATGYRLDFWADQNNNGKYDFDHAWEKDEIGRLDHSWRIFLDPAAPQDPAAQVTIANDSYLVAFSHHFGDFVDLNEIPDGVLPRKPPKDTQVPAAIHIANLGADRKMGQIRVADPSGHVVCLYRFKTMAQPTFLVPGCVEAGNVYDVDLYIDANGNNDANGNGYDDPSKGPGNDLGWRQRQQQAGDAATGLVVTFDAADVASGNVDVGAP